MFSDFNCVFCPVGFGVLDIYMYEYITKQTFFQENSRQNGNFLAVFVRRARRTVKLSIPIGAAKRYYIRVLPLCNINIDFMFIFILSVDIIFPACYTLQSTITRRRLISLRSNIKTRPAGRTVLLAAPVKTRRRRIELKKARRSVLFSGSPTVGLEPTTS